MADAVDTQVLISGQNRYVARFTNICDGTGESGVVKVDRSALTGPDGTSPLKLAIEEVDWDVQGFTYISVFWEDATDQQAMLLSGQGYKDYRHNSRLVPDTFGDQVATPANGDLTFTTAGNVLGDTYDITITLKLKD